MKMNKTNEIFHLGIHVLSTWLFSLGENSRKCWQDISYGDNFPDASLISLKYMGFISRGESFHEEGNIMKNAKITPTRKFPRLQCLDLEFLWEYVFILITKIFQS